jgi:hypothetical protein
VEQSDHCVSGCDPRERCRQILALDFACVPCTHDDADGLAVAIGHGYGLGVAVSKHAHALAPPAELVGFETQLDRSVTRAAWIVVAADRDEPDAGGFEPLNLPMER